LAYKKGELQIFAPLVCFLVAGAGFELVNAGGVTALEEALKDEN